MGAFVATLKSTFTKSINGFGETVKRIVSLKFSLSELLILKKRILFRKPCCTVVLLVFVVPIIELWPILWAMLYLVLLFDMFKEMLAIEVIVAFERDTLLFSICCECATKEVQINIKIKTPFKPIILEVNKKFYCY